MGLNSNGPPISPWAVRLLGQGPMGNGLFGDRRYIMFRISTGGPHKCVVPEEMGGGWRGVEE